MKKVILSFIILFAVILPYSTPQLTVYADTGPKPSINIEVNNLEGNYYLDLLVEGAVHTDSANDIYSQLNEEFVEYADALKSIRDPNINRFWLLDGTRVMVRGQDLVLTDADTARFTYMVPTTFKIVIIKENKDIIITNEITRIQFYSKLALDLKDNVRLVEGQINVYTYTGSVLQKNVVKDTVLGFLYRLLITLSVELFIAVFVFKITKKQALRIIIIFNIATQIVLNTLLFTLTSNTLNPVLNYFPAFFNLELFILCIETFAYRFLIKEYRPPRLVFYAIVANLVTAILTFVV